MNSVIKKMQNILLLAFCIQLLGVIFDFLLFKDGKELLSSAMQSDSLFEALSIPIAVRSGLEMIANGKIIFMTSMAISFAVLILGFKYYLPNNPDEKKKE